MSRVRTIDPLSRNIPVVYNALSVPESERLIRDNLDDVSTMAPISILWGFALSIPAVLITIAISISLSSMGLGIRSGGPFHIISRRL